MKRPATIDIRNGGPPPWLGPTLQTRQAQALMRGRPRQGSGKPALPGLEGFARAAARIHNAAADGDPCAERVLASIGAAIAEARAVLLTELRLMAALLEPGTGLAGPGYPARARQSPGLASPQVSRKASGAADTRRRPASQGE